MDEPSHHRGSLDHGGKTVEFYYPTVDAVAETSRAGIAEYCCSRRTSRDWRRRENRASTNRRMKASSSQ